MKVDRGFRLTRIRGIDIAIDWSLLIIFTLITVLLSTGVFPSWHPEWSTLLNWLVGLSAAVLFFVSVLIHELSHALVGRANGIEVRQITLFVFGGMAQMENEPPTWRAELAMTIVGPMTSLLLGMLCLWIGGIISGPIEINPDDPAAFVARLGPAATLLMWLGPVNIILGLFNLVPGFPLDGGRVLRALIWAATDDIYFATRWASRCGQGFAWLLIGTGLAMILGAQVPIFGGGVVNGLWLAFIGWFLNSAAIMGYHQLTLRSALEGVPVARLMQTRLTNLDPDVSLAEVVDDRMLTSGQRSFPVLESGRFAGLISISDIQSVPAEERSRKNVGEVMTPLAQLTTVGTRTDGMQAMSLLGRSGFNQLPVVEGDRCVGLLRREDMVRWLSLHFPDASVRKA